MQVETLEDRMLLAVGPQLVGIQPNDGELLVDGDVRSVAPLQLTFRFDDQQAIDPTSLTGIRITRSGSDDVLGNSNDQVIEPGFSGVDFNHPNEVIFRFAETLPDDLYQIDIFGSGDSPLTNTEGNPFLDGADESLKFKLNLGAQIIAVVPEPVTRLATGGLTQAKNQIVVYFNDDDLADTSSSAENPDFYQLIFTNVSPVNESVSNTDDIVYHPTTVNYNGATDKAVLTFSSNLTELGSGPGAYRLRIGTAEAVPLPPSATQIDVDPGSSFATAHPLGLLDPQSRVITSAIEPEFFPLDLPGSSSEPGHRDITMASHLADVPIGLRPSLYDQADEDPGVTTVRYNFRDLYGFDPEGNPLYNEITPEQKERTREIFGIFDTLWGMQSIETEADGLTIVTGDLRAVKAAVDTGPGGTIGIAGLSNGSPTAIMDKAELWFDSFGFSDTLNRLPWFKTAMHEIGHLLSLGHTYELPPLTVMGDDPALGFQNRLEPIFPGDHDVVHGRHLHRPESNDIDLYKFDVDTAGLFTAETVAERRSDSSLLDSALNLYQQMPDGSYHLVARNDDSFGEDSFLQLSLSPGTYFVGISASGNLSYDPMIEGTGFGGTSQGPYDLRLNLQIDTGESIIDADSDFAAASLSGTAIDGDANGIAGGIFNFWFRTQDAQHTIFVDKSHNPTADPLGTITNPYNNIAAALTGTAAGDVVRIVGNGGTDGNLETLDDNLAYEIGVSSLNQPLADGTSMNVPQNVTVMVDAGALFKMHKSHIGVGSAAVLIDHSGSALQVLGTPEQHVFFTSYSDPTIGSNTDPNDQVAEPGDWGGFIFRNDKDRASGRFDYEAQGVFLNTVNQADFRYGGGSVVIDSIPQVITPIHLIDTRPTISFNTITLSADAAMSASPDSFEETTFHTPQFQTESFTPDYVRRGPDIHGNRLVRHEDGEIFQNTTNGLFIRLLTPAGNALQPMTVPGHWDDADIVHVVEQNLIIDGTPGGPLGEPVLPTGNSVQDRYDLTARPDARLWVDPRVVVKLDGARIETEIGAQFIAEGLDGQEIIFTSLLDDRFGAGGTFDTTGDGNDNPAQPGDWGGLFLGPMSTGSIDHALIAYGGGKTPIEGSFAGFNALEVHQAEARITYSVFENNAHGTGGQATEIRAGRGFNAPGAIFIRGAQPIIVGNLIHNTVGNQAAAINVNVNALNHRLLSDYGRTTGQIDLIEQFGDNQGPLIRENRQFDNTINGMIVRGGTLTTEGVWDDTDIAHAVFEEIFITDFHTYGGLRLESSPTESLVVKLEGELAGFHTTGHPLEIDDRIGGMLHIIGQPGFPVILTSVSDGTVGAGFQPDGTPLSETRTAIWPFPLPKNPGLFNIQLNFSEEMAANPAAMETFERAAAVWEAILDDPITVVIDANFDVLEDNVAGQADPINVALAYSTLRQRMTADAGPHEALVNELPSFGQLDFVLPEDENNPFDVSSTMNVTRANALALGLDGEDLPQTLSQYNPDPTAPIDGTISINENSNVFGTNIFNVALHEIGHLLGFTSGVELVDAGEREVVISPMDLFRLAPGAGQISFADSVRVLDPSLDQVFYDGGLFNPTGIPIPDIALGDIPLSTGELTGDGFQSSHFKNDVLIAGVSLGVMEPSDGSLHNNDKRVLDLIGWDVISTWRGILFDAYTHDRNVDVITELEAPDLTAPGTNATPGTAEFLGVLAANEKAGDENLRLGFEVHGFLNSPGDVDVYSFTGRADTEIWLDIDHTTQTLDSVVELIDAEGHVLARSNNSDLEAKGQSSLFFDTAAFVSSDFRKEVNPLYKSPHLSHDHFTANPFDAGMRLLLPGPAGSENTYHVRVHSNGPDPNSEPGDGLTHGVYELNVRLQELDELAGSTVRFADIRYAINGIEALGQPIHSPLLGEIAEVTSPNGQDVNGRVSRSGSLTGTLFDEVGNIVAQPIGNFLTSDRAALGVAGNLHDFAQAGQTVPNGLFDVDWYQIEIAHDAVRSNNGTVSTVFDIDYADGAAGANIYLAVYRVIGNPADPGSITSVELVLSGTNSDVADDQPAPLEGADTDDLTRGGFGKLDPSIGPVSLPEGTYFVAVTSDAFRPQQLQEQFLTADASNPLLRLEPLDSIIRIAEDHYAGSRPVLNVLDLESPVEPPHLASLLGGTDKPNSSPNVVPFHLGDVTLFVSQHLSLKPDSTTTIRTVDPLTGALETTLGSFDPPVGDIAMRPDGTMYAFSVGYYAPDGPNDGNSADFIKIDTGTAEAEVLLENVIVTSCMSLALDDYVTCGEGEAGEGVGIQFEGMAFGFPSETALGDTLTLLAVGNRGAPDPLEGPIYEDNILFLFDASEYDANGLPVGSPLPQDRLREDMVDYGFPPGLGDPAPPAPDDGGAWTDYIELGHIDTLAGPGQGGTIKGLAIVAGELYAVSGPDANNVGGGGLFRVEITPDPDLLFSPIGYQVNTEHVKNLVDSGGEAIKFSGLTVGPPNVEEGLYAETLFAIDELGVIYTLDTDGNSANVLLDGQSSVATNLLGAHGLDFSTLDKNLWHITDNRDSDAGHGLFVPVTGSRLAELGGTSFYFGNEEDTFEEGNPRGNQTNYDVNFPGGAHGSLVTNSFSLADYTSGDEPVLYFNYFLETENDPTNPQTGSAADPDYSPATFPENRFRDSFRVFVADSSDEEQRGQWHLLATNNSYRDLLDNDEYDLVYGANNNNNLFGQNYGVVQELFDGASDEAGNVIAGGAGGWRQARIPLKQFSGSDDLRLRFDFSTAGSMQMGDPLAGGQELRAIAAADLRDGQTFVIDGVIFEFDLGTTLVVPGGSGIQDGETLTIDDGLVGPVTLEFDRRDQPGADGVSNGNIPVPVDGDESPAVLAAKLEQVLKENPQFNLWTLVIPEQTEISDGETFTLDNGINAPAVFEFEIAGGIDPASEFSILLPELTPEEPPLTASQVANLVRSTIDFISSNRLSGISTRIGGLEENRLTVIGVKEVIQGPLSAVQTSDATHLDGNRLNLKGDTTVTQTPAPGEVRTAVFVDGHPGRINPSVQTVLVPTPTLLGLDPLETNRTSSEVADEMVRTIALTFAEGNTDAIKRYGDTVRLHNHAVLTQGPLGLATWLPGDDFGAFSVSGPPEVTEYPGSLRGMNNTNEGVYIDDLIIGLAGRGEMVTGATNNTSFLANTELANFEILVGEYQLEVRSAPEYLGFGLTDFNEQGELATTFGGVRSFDANDRLSQDITLFAPEAAQIIPGQTFVVGDGINTVTFEFSDSTILEQNDTIDSVLQSGLATETTGTFVGIGAIGDNSNVNSTLDVDLIELDLSAGDLVTIDVDAFNPKNTAGVRSTLDSQLSLFNETGDTLLRADNALAPGENNPLGGMVRDPFMAFSAPASGRYFIGISGAENFEFDPLTANSGAPLILSPLATGAYRIEIEVNGGSPQLGTTVPIYYGTFDDAATMAQRITDVINGDLVQETLGLGVTALSQLRSRRVDLFGDVVVVPDLQKPRDENGPFVLDNGPGDGTVRMGVDGFGSFGLTVGEEQTDATYDPVGRIDPAVTVFTSGIAIGDLSTGRTFLTSGEIADTGNLANPEIQGTPIVGQSFFTAGNLFFELRQTVLPVLDEIDEQVGSVLTQTYTITNGSNDEKIFDIVRYLDGDLRFDGSLIDGGGRLIAADGTEFLFEIDSATGKADTTTFVGITAEGGEIPTNDRYEIARYTNLVDKIALGGDLSNTVAGDGFDEDEFIDQGFGYDVTMALRNVFAIAAGESEEYVTRTFFGSAVPDDIADLRTLIPQGIEGLMFNDIGDGNRKRDQGQLILEQIRIGHSAEFGIVVDAASRDGLGNAPHAGPPRHLNEINSERLSPGVIITNNIVFGGGRGGIHFSGDPNENGSPTVPFGRLINNTIFGQGGTMMPAVGQEDAAGVDVGIRVDHNASPTILNTIITNFDKAVDVDSTSSTSVLGGMLFQGNVLNSNLGQGDFPIVLTNSDPLFVDPFAGNFNLDAGSRAIDSSVDSLEDRLELVAVRSPLGISDSPILAPLRDITGQLRVDDPSIEPPEGLGYIVFKDRGALDRSDFVGPTATLIGPRDNDAVGEDLNPSLTVVQLSGQPISEFSIQLVDGLDPFNALSVGEGTGADPSTVTANSVTITQQNNATFDVTTLAEGVDYTFDFDATNKIVRLTPLAGVWPAFNTYVITLDNSTATGIKDLSNNSIRPNQLNGKTQFTIGMGAGRDFGDAPDPTFPTLVTNNGPSHLIQEQFFLGTGVDAELDGQPDTEARNDNLDDGIDFTTSFFVGAETSLKVTASGVGFLDAWVDFSGNGDWNEPDEQIFASQPLANGTNTLTVSIPETAAAGHAVARFRFSSTGGLTPIGEAADGEVEDYRVGIFENPWQNPINPLDSTNDNLVSAVDVLVLINEINSRIYSDPTSGQLPIPPEVPPSQTAGVPHFYDVDGNGALTPVDVLRVINHLNATSPVSASMAMSTVGELRIDTSPPETMPGTAQVGLTALVGWDLSGSQSAALVQASDRFATDLRVDTTDLVGKPSLPTSATAANLDSWLVSHDRPPHESGDELDQILGKIAVDVNEATSFDTPHDQFFAQLS